MAERKRGAILGWLGLFCFAILLIVTLAPQIADDQLGLSVAGKFTTLGIFLAAIVLPTIAAAKSSKWWLVVAALSLVTLADLYIRIARPTQ